MNKIIILFNQQEMRLAHDFLFSVSHKNSPSTEEQFS